MKKLPFQEDTKNQLKNQTKDHESTLCWVLHVCPSANCTTNLHPALPARRGCYVPWSQPKSSSDLPPSHLKAPGSPGDGPKTVQTNNDSHPMSPPNKGTTWDNITWINDHSRRDKYIDNIIQCRFLYPSHAAALKLSIYSYLNTNNTCYAHHIPKVCTTGRTSLQHLMKVWQLWI